MHAEGTLDQDDLNQTLENRKRLRSNSNLMYWYSRLYAEQFRDEPNIETQRILEIGSGTSPLKYFHPNVTTSDILALEYLDIVFDCHDIIGRPDIPDASLDVITMTNVLHHLRDPLTFLRGATRKLKKGGRVYLLEPYFSLLSYPMYKLLHHEPVDFTIARPILDRVYGPLSTSNQAMPFMIFFSRPDWLAELSDVYSSGQTKLSYFTGLSYPLTGGISQVFPVPSRLYRAAFAVDHTAAKFLPKLFASFFMARLTTRD